MKVFDEQATRYNIFDLASDKGWSDAKLARILEVTPQAISKWRRGVGCPSIDTIVRLAGLFQVSLDDLIGFKEIDMTFPLLD